jgi:hypothetical protein
MNKFEERFRDYTNQELLLIVENAVDYQPQAVETAKTELEKRNLSSDDLDAAKKALMDEKLIKENEDKKKEERIKKINNYFYSFIDNFNPVLKELPSSERIIRFVTLIFSAIFIYHFVKLFRILWFMITHVNSGWNLYLVYYLSPLILMPLTIILFWKRKPLGWIFLNIYLANSFLGSFYSFISSFQKINENSSEITKALFQPQSPVVYFGASVFFLSALISVFKKDIRDLYKMDKVKILLTIGLLILIIFIIVLISL